MKAYELLVLLNPSLDTETRVATLARIDSTITGEGGAIDNVDEWGKRKLAYEIDHITDGDYVLIDFHAKPESIAEINRILGITDAVMRSMVTHRPDRADAVNGAKPKAKAKAASETAETPAEATA